MISKILNTEIQENAVSSLASRPSSPSLYGGNMLSAKELRAAFDKLPLLLASRFNSLLDALGLYTDETTCERLAALVATELFEGHSLADLFADISSGRFSSYLSINGEQSLTEILSLCQEEITSLGEAVDTLTHSDEAFFKELQEQKKALADQTQKQANDDQERKADILSLDTKTQNALSALRNDVKTTFRISELPSDDYAKVYRLEYKDETSYSPVLHSVDINIPKDLVVKSGELCYAVKDGVPVASYQKGEAYIDLTLSTADSQHIYIRVGDLVKTTILYTEGSGDMITEITAVGNSLTLHRGLSSATFAKAEEVKALQTALADIPPHVLTDEATGKVYRYSLAIQNGKPGLLITEKV
ncbi:MAG: hypothetical protein J6K61_04915 [Clostridia bacterium]|nr:hypothetical protein [Clostridia bacterium]